jgi:hypothetical protein
LVPLRTVGGGIALTRYAQNGAFRAFLAMTVFLNGIAALWGAESKSLVFAYPPRSINGRQQCENNRGGTCLYPLFAGKADPMITPNPASPTLV